MIWKIIKPFVSSTRKAKGKISMWKDSFKDDLGENYLCLKFIHGVLFSSKTFSPGASLERENKGLMYGTILFNFYRF